MVTAPVAGNRESKRPAGFTPCLPLGASLDLYGALENLCGVRRPGR